jgi:hypothetical protein
MSEHLVSKTINPCVVKLGKTQNTRSAHGAQPMSEASALAEANAVGLTYVPRLELDRFESQSDSLRLNQRLPRQC